MASPLQEIIRAGRALIDASTARLRMAEVCISDTRRIVQRFGSEVPERPKPPPPLPLNANPNVRLEVQIARGLVVASTARMATSRELIRIAHVLIECSESLNRPVPSCEG